MTIKSEFNESSIIFPGSKILFLKKFLEDLLSKNVTKI